MTPSARAPIRSPSSAVPALAGALVAGAYVVGAIVFSFASQTGGAKSDPDLPPAGSPARTEIALTRHISPDPATTAGPSTAEVARAPDEDENVSGPAGPRIAIVIDDVGLDVDAARRVIALDAGVTLAVLPYAQAAGAISAEAAAAGHDVLLHMPMEPVGLADPGPNALRLGLSDADLAARMLWGMAQVPEAVGLNNHMGSRFTADPRALRVALSAVSDRDPLFLDSLTTGRSRGRAVAEGLGLATLERDIFLDHVQTEDEVIARLDETEALARARGWAVAIGHPHDETLDVLEDWIVQARTRGIEFVTVTALSAQIARQSVPTAAVPMSEMSAFQ